MEQFTSSEATGPVTGLCRAVNLELVDGLGRVADLPAEFRYDAQDPYAVSVTFQTGGPGVTWTFARDLLVSGLGEPAGDGDVHVWPCLDADGRPVTIIELQSPGGEALVQARTSDIASFVRAITDLVPIGAESEHLDVDGLITALFAA